LMVGPVARMAARNGSEGSLTTEQRSKLLEIANKCPVHRTLTSEIDTKTRVV
jgi:putative redox protein